MLHVLQDSNDNTYLSNKLNVLLVTLCVSMNIVPVWLHCNLPLKRFSWNIHLHDSAKWRGSYLIGLERCVYSIGRQTSYCQYVIWHKVIFPQGGAWWLIRSAAFTFQCVSVLLEVLENVCNINIKILIWAIMQTGAWVISLYKNTFKLRV